MRGLVVRYGYKEWGNIGCFGNLIVVCGSVLYNILYCVVESSSLIRGRSMVGRTTLKPCVPYVWLFYLCVLELILLASKLSLALQLVSELRLKTFGRVKYHKTHKMKTKGIFTEGGVDCSFVVIWYKKVCVMERLKINFMEFGPR